MKYVALFLLAAVAHGAGRTAIPLNGEWQVEESASATPIPAQFSHRAAVPGLTNQAVPAFPGIDEFDSRELIATRIREKSLPESARVQSAGITKQTRNYFWYRRTFQLDALGAWATLKVDKAQFGTAVWVNGKPAGEHLGCFTAGFFDVRPLLQRGENVVIIRIGAHPAVLPSWAPAGTDFEKYKWTPGIYDSVSLATGDYPRIEAVQVAPRLADSSALVEAVLFNGASTPARFALRLSVSPWKGQPQARDTHNVELAPGERRTVRYSVPVRNAKLWTPEEPNLYTLALDTPGDSHSVRFGMREFRFDTATKRAYLNGKLYFLRGSNITLHRFFEDPAAKALPWDEKWVRRLLTDLPKQMSWNSFRLCIGPVPNFWLDIADETGLLLQYEFFIWNGRSDFPPYSTEELTTQYTEWLRDNWNHPSVAIWDASNETDSAVLRDTVVPEVRKLDLSNRPWENGYAVPTGANDPVEDHPYLFSRIYSGRDFSMTELEQMTGAKTTNAGHPSGHAVILNEYGWLWLNRDGTPTFLTERVYERLLGNDATPRQRLELYAYYLAGLTEFWRAHRNFAGVLHFTWLTCSYPGVKTSDHWSDVTSLTLEPNFANWVKESFKPLGVYVNFWQPQVKQGERRSYAVMMVNDDPVAVKGTLALTFDKDGMARASATQPFELDPYGAMTYMLTLEAPKIPGDYMLQGAAVVAGRAPTLSRRKVVIH